MATRWSRRLRELGALEPVDGAPEQLAHLTELRAVALREFDTEPNAPPRWLRIPLGLSFRAMPTENQLRERTRLRAEAVHAGKRRLDFLIDSEESKPVRYTVINEDEFCAVFEIPTSCQQDWIGQQSASTEQAESDGAPCGDVDGQRNESGAPTASADASDAPGERYEPWRQAQQNARMAEAQRRAHTQLCLEEVEANAQLCDRVAELMTYSRDLKTDLQVLEHQTGSDTLPIRRLIFHKQGPMDVEVDGAPVHFRKHEVRVSAPISEETEISANITLGGEAWKAVLANVQTVAGADVKPWEQLGARAQVPIRFDQLSTSELGLLLFLGDKVLLPLRGRLHAATCNYRRRHAQVELAVSWERVYLAALRMILARCGEGDPSSKSGAD